MDFLQKYPNPWGFKGLSKEEFGAGYEAIVDAHGQEVIASVGGEEYQSWLRGDVKELIDWVNTMSDLPAPSQKLVYGEPVWKLSRKAFVSSWVDEAGPMVELSVGRGCYITPTDARRLAYMLLAAAQWAEKEYGK